MKMYFIEGQVTHDLMLFFGSENKITSEYLLLGRQIKYGIIWKLFLLRNTI